jgi:hypothetical protein
LRIEISSEPELGEAREQVASLLRLGAHALADPSDGPPPDPYSRQIAVLEVLTASHAAVSSKLRVNPASCRAHGTAATTTPWRLHSTRGRVGLQEAQRRAEIQRAPPPATLAKVLSRAAPPAVRAAIPLAETPADRHHDRVVLVELDPLDHQ